MSDQIIWFKDCSYRNKELVGGKCSSLGELHSISRRIGFSIGDGFAITTTMYDDYVRQNELEEVIETKLAAIDTTNIQKLEEQSKELRDIVAAGNLSEEQASSISNTYQ